jgi:glutamate formiminotransferase/formiminotetrahydrofolate cyclodeaminase
MDLKKQIIECVPNFSEGNDQECIQKIVQAIASVNGLKVMHVDSGMAANRTVVTFAGSPEAVVEGAFRGIQMAGQSIDMRQQKGTHPRIGATDVCPLVPVSGIGMEEVVECSKILAKRVGDELGIPVYLYEHSATVPARKGLENIRSGEYEGLPEKLKDHAWKPDFGPVAFNAKAGATVIGARKLLVAYNINLNTSSVKIASAIAAKVRASGYLKRKDDAPGGQLIKDEQGKNIRIPGLLKYVKAIGWYIDEYKQAQVSVNITDYTQTAVHTVFETVSEVAKTYGVKVTGSELIGLIPLNAMLDAGSFFAKKEGCMDFLTDEEKIKKAIFYMGMDALAPFDPQQKIIEYLL